MAKTIILTEQKVDMQQASMQQSVVKTKNQGQRRSALILLISTLLILVVGMTTLLWQEQQRQHSRADMSVMAGATLPAATVNQILAGTPMAGQGQIIEETSAKTGIDDAFALAVWYSETNDGAAGVGLGYRNPGGVRSSAGYPLGNGGYTIYPTYAAAIVDWFTIVQSRYVNRGLTSVYTICYPYVGTSGAATWAGKVTNLMVRYHAMAPAPTPTPTPTPTPKPRDWVQEQAVPTVQPVQHPSKQQGQSSSQTNKTQAKTSETAIAVPQLKTATSTGPTVPLGLLVALLIAGGAFWLNRRTTSTVLVTTTIQTRQTETLVASFEQIVAQAFEKEPVEVGGKHTTTGLLNLPPVYVNEISPVAERYAPVLQPVQSAPLTFKKPLANLSAIPEAAFVAAGSMASYAQPHHQPYHSTLQTHHTSIVPQETFPVGQLQFQPFKTASTPIAYPGPGLTLAGYNGPIEAPLVPANNQPQPSAQETVSTQFAGGGLLRRYGDHSFRKTRLKGVDKLDNTM